MELKLNRIQKISNIVRIVCKVLYILSIVGACISIFGYISFEIFGKFNIKLSGVDIYNMIDDFEKMSKTEICMEIISAVAECVVGAVIFGSGERYLKKELADGTPFTEDGSKAILRLGIIAIAVPLIASTIVSAIGEITKTKAYLEPGISVSAGIIMILLSFIFSYGAELEKNKQIGTGDNSPKE